jgi:hypothetical protein
LIFYRKDQKILTAKNAKKKPQSSQRISLQATNLTSEVSCEGRRMKFAKVVFWIAAVWGILVLTPLYFMFDVIGRQDPPPITHPAFYYGFVSVALA